MAYWQWEPPVKVLTGERWKSSVWSGVEVEGVSRKLQKPGWNDHEEEVIIWAKGIKEWLVETTPNRRASGGWKWRGKKIFLHRPCPFYRRGGHFHRRGTISRGTSRPAVTLLGGDGGRAPGGSHALFVRIPGGWQVGSPSRLNMGQPTLSELNCFLFYSN
jgi:hypothetical protein